MNDRSVTTLYPFLAGCLAVAVLLICGCRAVSKVPELAGGAVSKVNPVPVFAHAARVANPMNWFGGDEESSNRDRKAEKEAEFGRNLPEAQPGSARVGTVFMVDRKNDFLLIRSSSKVDLEYGTELISQNEEGRQTAVLKLSPERKAAFLVADIVKGDPEEGDAVKMVGINDPRRGGLVPMQEGEVEILE